MATNTKEKSHSDTVELAQQLIRRKSVSPNDGGCQGIIAERLERLGFEIRFLNSGDVTNLWARKGSSSPLLTFVGHTDVVPAGDESLWKYPPFDGVIENGFLHGRGAADMKSSIAAMVTALERYCADQSETQGSISLLITSDEEDVAEEGTFYALETLGREANEIRYCLVGEPTSEKILGDTIKIGRRGSLDGKIIVHGKQGHVAYPHLADNPIHKTGALLAKMAQLSWHDGDDDFPNTTMQISNIHSGVGAGNVIPQDLEMLFNFRFSAKTPAADLKDAIKKICEESQVECSLSWSDPSDPYYTKDREFFDLVFNSVKKTLQRMPVRSTAGGTSDGRFVAKTGAQVVELGPLNSTIHKVDERIEISELYDLTRVYKQILVDTFS